MISKLIHTTFGCLFTTSVAIGQVSATGNIAANGVSGFAPGATAVDYSGHGEPVRSGFAWTLGNGGTVNAKWPGGLLKWFYRPTGQPADLTTDQVVAAIQRAMVRWSDVCNIAFSYQGTTSNKPNLNATYDTTDRVPVIGWDTLTGFRAQLGGYTSWWYLNSGSMIDTDFVINTAVWNVGQPFSAARLFDLEGLFVHEVGHMLAIEHSDAAQSVMYATPYNSYKFQNTLRGDDVAACVQMYGASFRSDTNRVFNWAEVTYEQFFAPVGGVSAEYAGYLYRYYSNTDSYVGFKDGTLYVLLPGSEITPVGVQADFLPTAVNDGF